MQTTTDLQTQTATHLSAIELGLGSFLHAFKIPFAGHFLSLNQGFFLSHSVRVLSTSTNNNRFCISKIIFEISILTAILKSLSPAGQKWGPMLSISMQGLFFLVGIFIFGANLLGSMLGIILLSIWAFIQPFMTLLVSFGFPQMQKIIIFYTDRLNSDYHITSQNLWIVVFSILTIKITFAILIVFISFYLKIDKVKFMQKKLQTQYKSNIKFKNDPRKTIHQKVFSDLTRPLFLFSMMLALIFLFMTEINSVSFLWQALRPVATAILIFYFLRSEASQKILTHLVSKSNYLNSLYTKSQIIFNQLD